MASHPYDRAMGFLQRFLTGDVLDRLELSAAERDGVALHVRKARSVSPRPLPSTGQALQREAPPLLWRRAGVEPSGRALGSRCVQLDLAREDLPSPSSHVSADPDVLQVSFAAANFHPDRCGRVKVRLWTSEAHRVTNLLTS